MSNGDGQRQADREREAERKMHVGTGKRRMESREENGRMEGINGRNGRTEG